MSQETPLGDLLDRVRAGQPDVIAELVREYEPLVRRAVRARLTDARLRRVFDSTDVCQSVFRSFCARAAAGEFDLERPEHLIGLLVQMARNKLAGLARYHRRDKRDVRRVAADGGEQLGALTEGPAPDQIAAGRELLTKVRAELTAEERAIADHRAAGRTWDDVARELGGTAEARRKQYERAIGRVAVRLGVDENEPET